MKLNTALEAIYAIQKQLDEEADHSLKTYVENTHHHIRKMESMYGFTVHYGERLGGYESVLEASSSSTRSKKERVLTEA